MPSPCANPAQPLVLLSRTVQNYIEARRAAGFKFVPRLDFVAAAYA